MDVTAHTTLDAVRGTAHGLDWADEAAAVVDVDTSDDPRAVALEIELDPIDLEHPGAHADTVWLSPTEARTLAAELTDAADAVDGDTAPEVTGE